MNLSRLTDADVCSWIKKNNYKYHLTPYQIDCFIAIAEDKEVWMARGTGRTTVINALTDMIAEYYDKNTKDESSVKWYVTYTPAIKAGFLPESLKNREVVYI